MEMIANRNFYVKNLTAFFMEMLIFLIEELSTLSKWTVLDLTATHLLRDFRP
jgi:hypothetical protein